jgi:hypothetical protein
MARNPVFHARTEHIEIMYHFIREKVMSKQIDIQHVATQDQTADILTKALGTTKFQKHRYSLGIANYRDLE